VKFDWQRAWNAMTEATRRVPGVLTRISEDTAWSIVHYAQELATEELSDATTYNASFEVDVEPMKASVRNVHPAALYLEEGTKPHLIFPTKQALRFLGREKIVYTRWVRHPGILGHAFLGVGRMMAEATLLEIVGNIGRELIE